MAEHDPALVEKAALAIACGWCHATNHEQCREWNKPIDTLHSMRLYDARAVLDAVVPAIREAALNEVRERIGLLGVRNDSAQKWGITTVLHLLDDMAAQQQEEPTDGC